MINILLTSFSRSILTRLGRRKFISRVRSRLVLPVSLRGTKVPVVACDAEGIHAMHSNFKLIFRNVEQNLQSGWLHNWATLSLF